MQTIETISELRQAIAQLERPLGLVPTMGFLHEGHLSLVRLAKEQSKSVVTSIFVNPTQFGPNEDLDAYPHDIPKDLGLLEAEGVDLVWIPTPEMMYPDDFQTWVDVAEMPQVLEGAQRPGHFKGVTTVVAKLFNSVQPDKAFFGQKDAQQVAVIKQMVRDLNFPLEIVVGAIQREADGLALSSRNVYLDAEQRQAATVLSRALYTAKEAFESGECSGDALRQAMRDTIEAEPLANLQYVSCAHPHSLQELDEVAEAGALLSMAVYIGKTRLIDNILIVISD